MLFNKEYTHVIWDFNGTILDDVNTGIESVNILLSERGLPTIASVDQYHELFGFPIIDYYKRLGFNLTKEQYNEIAILWVEQYNKRRKYAPLCLGAKELLAKFKGLHISQIIISATELNMLRAQVIELGIDGYFDELIGLDNIYAASKEHLAVQWREHNKMSVPLFIGDTDHDLTTARAMSCDCVLVANGHQSFDYLNSIGCPVVHDLNELSNLLFVN